MTGTEFHNGVARLEQFYQKRLEEYEKDIWYKELGKMRVERFNQIIQKAYTQCKFMPKLADIFEINKEIPYIEKQKEIKTVECPKCKSTGIVLYTKMINNRAYTYGARCTCENAKKHSFKIPSIQQIGI